MMQCATRTMSCCHPNAHWYEDPPTPLALLSWCRALKTNAPYHEAHEVGLATSHNEHKHDACAVVMALHTAQSKLRD